MLLSLRRGAVIQNRPGPCRNTLAVSRLLSSAPPSKRMMEAIIMELRTVQGERIKGLPRATHISAGRVLRLLKARGIRTALLVKDWDGVVFKGESQEAALRILQASGVADVRLLARTCLLTSLLEFCVAPCRANSARTSTTSCRKTSCVGFTPPTSAGSAKGRRSPSRRQACG